jgi:hypothetical protein
MPGERAEARAAFSDQLLTKERKTWKDRMEANEAAEDSMVFMFYSSFLILYA